MKSIYSNRCWLDGKLQPATVCFENGIITEIHHHKIDEAEDAGDSIFLSCALGHLALSEAFKNTVYDVFSFIFFVYSILKQLVNFG